MKFHSFFFLNLLWFFFIFYIFLKFLFLLYFTLQYCIGFAIHWHESTTGVHAFPNMNLPPHNISLGHPCAPAPSILYESVLIRWMKLEPIIQSEVSQKEKHQYSILTHIYGIWEDGNEYPVCETAKETQMCIADFWTLRERERVGWFGRMAL